jgi:hypothetical protein
MMPPLGFVLLHPGHIGISQVTLPVAGSVTSPVHSCGTPLGCTKLMLQDCPVGTGVVSESSTVPSQFQSQLPFAARVV